MLLKELFPFGRMRRDLFYFLCVLLTMLLQNHLCPHIHLLNTTPLIATAIVMAIALFSGSMCGGIFGIITGMLCDNSFLDTTVLFTLWYGILGFGTGLIFRYFFHKKIFSFVIYGIAGMILTGAVHAFPVLAFHDAGPISVVVETLSQTAVSFIYLVPAFYLIRKIAQASDEEERL